MIQGSNITSAAVAFQGTPITFQGSEPAGIAPGLHNMTIDTVTAIPRHPQSMVAQVSIVNNGKNDAVFVTRPALLEPIGKLSIAAALGGVIGILLGKYAL